MGRAKGDTHNRCFSAHGDRWPGHWRRLPATLQNPGGVTGAPLHYATSHPLTQSPAAES